MEKLHPGIWKLSFGNPEDATPVSLRFRPPASKTLESRTDRPFPLDRTRIQTRASARGYEIHLPLLEAEQLFGLGLQFHSLTQRGKKKMLRVNADPKADLGDTHAPVPFYVSTQGYAVLIDSFRNLTVHMGNSTPRTARRGAAVDAAHNASQADSEEQLYSRTADTTNARVIVDIPVAQGADVYIFAGDNVNDAVAAYNLFSGGGFVPPRWGLGVWYHARNTFTQQQAIDLALQLRKDHIPCDVYGLEPGWQSQAYSCSWTWNDNFPDPNRFGAELEEQHYKLNLWTHIYAHPTCPVHKQLEPLSGDYDVWGGLVPDILLPEARQIIIDQHDQAHVAVGASGYKLDECDNSDYTGGWGFPNVAAFPSGVDGEQMHSALGTGYQHTIETIFRNRNQRTYNLVRSSHALAAPFPFVLYSDLYDHRQFIRALVTSGFSGLLWTPEVRHAADPEDLLRRIQAVVLSPLALINAWYIDNPPWKQWNRQLNNEGKFADEFSAVQDACREILELRMRLIPYIHAAFFQYFEEGKAPFRALAMDYPDDLQTHRIDDQWMVGNHLLVAPAFAGQTTRMIYLPEGRWYDFWTSKAYEGGQSISQMVPITQIPLFVRAGTLLPLAQVTQHTDDPQSLHLQVHVYGPNAEPFNLYEEDNRTYAYEEGQFNRLTLSWDAAKRQGSVQRQSNGNYPPYTIDRWVTGS